MVTRDRLLELLDFSPGCGTFRKRMVRRGPTAAGAPVGTVTEGGYRRIRLDGKQYYAHRLVWLWLTGDLPGLHIDHINGDRLDNRPGNLRQVDRVTNLQNQRKAKSSNKTSGLLGSSWDSEREKWTARIKVGEKCLFLGRFDTAKEAHLAYVATKRRLHAGCTI